jgi:hypothetical protein
LAAFHSSWVARKAIITEIRCALYPARFASIGLDVSLRGSPVVIMNARDVHCNGATIPLHRINVPILSPVAERRRERAPDLYSEGRYDSLCLTKAVRRYILQTNPESISVLSVIGIGVGRLLGDS